MTAYELAIAQELFRRLWEEYRAVYLALPESVEIRDKA